MIDPERFVRTMRPALRQAAAIARALEGRVQNRPKPGEASDVKAALTVADSAAQEAILVPLLDHFPEVCLAAEEDTPSVARFPASARSRVVVDPIDGTLRAYLGGEGPYAVMVGLETDERYEAALLALPREELFFEAVRGAGAWCAHGDGGFERVDARGRADHVVLSFDAPASVRERLGERGLRVGHGCGGAIALAPLLVQPGLGLRLAPVPGGVSIRGRIGALVAREAGALVATGEGDPFPESTVEPAPQLLVAGDPEQLEDLRFAATPA